MTHFKDLVQIRRSHRKFTEQEIDGDDVKLILRAALMAPTSKGQRAWQFVVVDDVNPSRRSSGSHFYIVWGKTFSSMDLSNIQLRLDTLTNHTVTMTPEMLQTYKRIGGTPHLDGQYTVFGQVIEGLDVVERIQKMFTDDYDRPVDDVRIIKATCQ